MIFGRVIFEIDMAFLKIRVGLFKDRGGAFLRTTTFWSQGGFFTIKGTLLFFLSFP